MPPAAPTESGQLRTEYTSEEVSEIIRVALEDAGDSERVSVNKDELLKIAQEFGLSESSLVRAQQSLDTVMEKKDISVQAMRHVKINGICYAAGVVGIFLVNVVVIGLADSPAVWWFPLAAAAYAPVFLVHGLLAKFYPDLAYSMFHKEEE